MTTKLPADVEIKILDQLEHSENLDDIILGLCESQGLEWQEAETLVLTLRARHANDITIHQSPVLVMIALALFLGGMGLAAYTVVNLAGTYHGFLEINGNAEKSEAGALGFFLMYLLSNAHELLWGLLISAAMIIGSLRGMTEVWSAVFAKLGWFQGVE